MLPLFEYDGAWLVGAALLALPAVWVAVARHSLSVFSRKALLEKVPAAEGERVERSLGLVDEFEAALRVVDFVLRLGLVLSLVAGRLTWLRTGTGDPAASGGWTYPDTYPEQLWHVSLVGLEALLLSLVFLKWLPTVVARAWAETFLLRSLPLFHALYRVLEPGRTAFERVVRLAVTLLGVREKRTSADIVEEEILSAAEEGEREGILHSRDIDMIESIIDFRNVDVADVMTPRTDMVCLDLDDPLAVNLERVMDCGHSRIPVFRETKDNVQGILYVKDLLRPLYRREDIDLGSIARQPYLVPLTKKVGELLQEFRANRLHIAMVVDEYGGIAGLVTIEDILEEIVGEISDEFEKEEVAPIVQLPTGEIEVDASVHIHDLNDELHMHLPEDETYDTVGGFLFARMGRIPAKGDCFEHEGVRFKVIEADERRVHRLQLVLPRREEGVAPPVPSEK